MRAPLATVQNNMFEFPTVWRLDRDSSVHALHVREAGALISDSVALWASVE